MKKNLSSALVVIQLFLCALFNALVAIVLLCTCLCAVTHFFPQFATETLQQIKSENPELFNEIVDTVSRTIVSVRLLFILIIVSLSLVASTVSPHIQHFFAARRFKKTDLCKCLQKYVDSLLDSDAELKKRIGHVTVGLADSEIYQGCSAFKHRVFISMPWVYAATATTEGLEMVKTTLCHEIGHLIDNSYSNFLKNCFINLIRMTPPGKRIIWEKEFNADFYGAKLYGNKTMFLHKMKFMKNEYEKEEPATLKDHPTWYLRIHAIEKDLHYSRQEVKEIFAEYRKHLKELRRNRKNK